MTNYGKLNEQINKCLDAIQTSTEPQNLFWMSYSTATGKTALKAISKAATERNINHVLRDDKVTLGIHSISLCVPENLEELTNFVDFLDCDGEPWEGEEKWPTPEINLRFAFP